MVFSITETTTLVDAEEYLERNEYTEEIVQFILEKGEIYDLDFIRDNLHYPMIIWATMNSRIKSSENTVKKLIDAGADLNLQTEEGETALIFASCFSNTQSTENTVKLLIDGGAELNLQKENGESALILASYLSNTTSTENTVKMLIDAGADLNKQTKNGDTALTIASCFTNRSSSENTVKMLIDAGADLNLRTNEGETALILASCFSNTTSTENTVKMLIDAGADLNLQANSGDTALIFACGNIDTTSTGNTVKMLVEAGADLNKQLKTGETAYDILKNKIPTSPLLKILNPNKPNPLLEQRIGLNITKTVSFQDPIMQTEEDINVGEYIMADKDNIVIVYDKNRYFFTTRETIMTQKADATIFPCKVPDTMRVENIVRDKPLYDLKKIGFVAGYPCNISKIFENPDNQLFALINTEEKYPSFVSENILDRGGSFVSGLHCQAGQESKISYMIVAVPSVQDNPETVQMGGVRTLEEIRLFERKSKKTKKTRKSKKSKKSKKTRKYKKL
jgi:ankyrin repeat protein